ncbi:hypothetical protein PLICRDRAFT_37446 [Plicaturopsis crispa FD-325 SS-3]|nr:hypothetical protein PLICRDRAFT_37446 [Plicaturopsis crispa FD-325 SS-3]
MPHADSAILPASVQSGSKANFWAHVHTQLAALLEGQRDWVTNLSNASALVYASLRAYDPHFGAGDRAVNWCGFYIHPALFPRPTLSLSVPPPVSNSFATLSAPPIFPSSSTSSLSLPQEAPSPSALLAPPTNLLLGPFSGLPACQSIALAPPNRPRGVCGDAFTRRLTVVVPEVDKYPGHIACDAETKSEIVIPLLYRPAHGGLSAASLNLRPSGYADEDREGEREDEVVHALGVFDLDCVASDAWTEDDRVGLERITELVVDSCDW